MPNFPNINTLSPKLNLTGDEIIQISATETTTLKKLFAQLGLTKDKPLGAFNYTPDGGDFEVPIPTDSLEEVLTKIVSRAGSNKFYIAPIYSHDEDGQRIPGMTTIIVLTRPENPIQHPDSNSLHRIKISYEGWIEVTGVDSVEDDMFVEHIEYAFHSLKDMDTYLDNSSQYTILFNGEHQVIAETANIVFGPGDIIYHTGNSVSDVRMSGAFKYNNVVKYQNYNAMIVTKANLTKNMFKYDSQGYTGGFKYLFMKDFNDNPGTTWQCITIQRVGFEVTTGNANIPILLVNKCGYSE